MTRGRSGSLGLSHVEYGVYNLMKRLPQSLHENILLAKALMQLISKLKTHYTVINSTGNRK